MPTQKKSRKNRNIQKKKMLIALIAFLLTISVVLIGVHIASSSPTDAERLSLTYLDTLKRTDLAIDLEESFEQTKKISDYTIYGESLTLYENDYDSTVTDPLYGKKVSLVNIETGQEVSTVFTGGADAGFDLGDLDPGVYEIYAYDGYEKLRLYMDEPMETEVFTTVRRNKEVNDCVLVANASYLSKFGVEQDKNYLYLCVTRTLPKVKIADVILDPSGLEEFTEDGSENESEKSWNLAVMISEILQQNGLKVLISRDADNAVYYEGTEGRIEQAYNVQAKVMLTLCMDDGDYERPYLITSPLTNGRLANAISSALAGSGIELQKVSGNSQLEQGVAFDGYIADYETGEYTPYSSSLVLRETGGKATSAGSYYGWSVSSVRGDDAGIYSVIFCYASLESQQSQSYYDQNDVTIATAVASGILNYLQIENPQLPEQEVLQEILQEKQQADADSQNDSSGQEESAD
jgi:hypothetical protein